MGVQYKKFDDGSSKCEIITDKYFVGSNEDVDKGWNCYKKIRNFGSYHTFEKDNVQLYNLVQDVYEVTLWIELSQPLMFCKENMYHKVTMQWTMSGINPHYAPNSRNIYQT